MAIASLLFIIGCGGGSSTTELTSAIADINITDEYQVESLGKENSIHVTINLGDRPKSLYILLSNYSQTQFASSTITHNKIVSAPENKIFSSTPLLEQPKVLHAPAYIQAFNAKIKTLLLSNKKTLERQSKVLATTVKREKDIVGNSQRFYLDEVRYKSTLATARKVVSNVTTVFGTKTLNIWVSDDSFDSGFGCSKSKCVTQEMVDALADTFLKVGSDNDIYDWVTNIYGEEWGSDAQAKYSNLIGESDEITILLTDIDGDNSPIGGVVGYFWAKDNFDNSTISGSNERIMFYVDSVMFANGEGSWDIDDFWPKEIVSTLAHEFQHMIHFYQKTILLVDANSSDDEDTWINEMLSETTEDVIATKIRYNGPRGVDYRDGSAGESGNTKGRYPLFNQNNTLSLTTWYNSDYDYSKVNAFGAFLIRNYGGAKVLHDIMHSSLLHEDAIVDAVRKSPQGEGKTFDDLLKEWGIAVLLSNRTDLENTPTYNTGDFTLDRYNNITYELGSINFFNYDSLPKINTIAGTVQPQGNYYYKVGDNLTGIVTIDLTLNGTTEATLIAK